MAVRDLLAELERRGVELAADGERLRYRPRDAVSSELRATIIDHKPELLARLANEEAEARRRVDADCDPPPTAGLPAALSLDGVYSLPRERDGALAVEAGDRLRYQGPPFAADDPPADRAPSSEGPTAAIASLGPPLDALVPRLRDLDAQIYVENGQPHCVGPNLAEDDPIHAVIAEHRELLVEYFTHAPGGRCGVAGCYRLPVSFDSNACPDHVASLALRPGAGDQSDGAAGVTTSPPAPYVQVGLTTFYIGDSVEVLNALPPGSAGLVGGSPPYALGKDYGAASDTTTYEEWLDWLGSVSRAVWRVLEEGGRYWLNIPFDTNLQFDPDGRKRSSKQPVQADVTHLLVREHGWTFNSLINWDEGNVSRRTAWGSFARPTDPWVLLASEAILVLSKGPRRREVRERTWDLLPEEFKDWTLANWPIPGESAKRIGHPAPFPIELPHRMIKLYSFKEDLVIDPWGGSGTTNLAASRLGRPNVYIDVNPDFADLAQARLLRGHRVGRGANRSGPFALPQGKRAAPVGRPPSTRAVGGPRSRQGTRARGPLRAGVS